MSWTSRPEANACCAGPLGAVQDSETIARLLWLKPPPSGFVPFRRSEIFAPQQFSNVCGKQDGCSVDRSDHLSDSEIRKRACDLAAIRPGRNGGGAKIAEVGKLRAIRLPKPPKDVEQVIFVYDDPLTGNDEHAVVRGYEKLSRGEQGVVIGEIETAFSSSITA